MTQCIATTANGTRCRNFVGKGKKFFCNRHSNSNKYSGSKSKSNTTRGAVSCKFKSKQLGG